MKVSNWSRWTHFKKKVAVALIITGILLGFCAEQGSFGWGVLGVIIASAGLLIFNTIKPYDWL